MLFQTDRMTVEKHARHLPGCDHLLGFYIITIVIIIIIIIVPIIINIILIVNIIFVIILIIEGMPRLI